MAYIKMTGIFKEEGVANSYYVKWTLEGAKIAHVDHYDVDWYYKAGGTWFGPTEIDSKNHGGPEKYSPPDNAISIKVKVRAVSTTYKKKVNKKTVTKRHFETTDYASFEYVLPEKPPVLSSAPTVSSNGITITAYYSGLDSYIDKVDFRVLNEARTVIYTSATFPTTNGYVSFIYNIPVGSTYVIQARAWHGFITSEWSPESAACGSRPAAPASITDLHRVRSSVDGSTQHIYIEWNTASNATGYEIQYTTNSGYFDSSPSNVKSVSLDAVNHAEITDADAGMMWFFRVRAKNEHGESGWTPMQHIAVGARPSPPTTWASRNTAYVGEKVILYWTHNTQDESEQTHAHIQVNINGVSQQFTVDGDTKSYIIDTSTYAEDTIIKWKVETAGVTEEYSDYSIERTITLYLKPTLTIHVHALDSSLTEYVTNPERIYAFPFKIICDSGPTTQTPLYYNISIVANETYDTTDSMGNTQIIKYGEEVFSEYYEAPLSPGAAWRIVADISASNVNLDDGISYTIKASVTTNVGLTGESSYRFTVSWSDERMIPDAEIWYNHDTFTTSVRPYCVDNNGNYIENITLSLYRIEFDGSLTKIIDRLANTDLQYVEDPHPSLYYARYRIVAISEITGAVNYCDTTGFPICESSVIIQWDEKWSSFVVNENGDIPSEPSWSGSLLELPYNIDISANYDPDVELVSYIGRKRKVSYYGTQLGETSTWNMDIPKSDYETLYTLRRLAAWTGDVYIREPSGMGFWANVKVGYSTKHCELVVPITLTVTRVEGGQYYG